MTLLKAILLSAMFYSAGLFAGNDMPINLSSIPKALEKLKNNPAANISQQAGWTVISLVKDGNHVIWFFAPEDHAAYPAVIKRSVQDKNGGIEITTRTFCESTKPKCDALAEQFKKLNKDVK
ncbi:MAG: hypothetical protein OQL06_04240 [Gammaproteobacteria bacterium]|nr:hypothetical protein [Gammaproteobacteria bacterium]